MAITSRQELADYCLRKLGAPSIVIEVDPLHLEDAIEDTIQFYNEHHFDGIIRSYLSHKITGTKLTLSSAAGMNKGDTLISADLGTRATIYEVAGNEVTINHQIGYDKFMLNQSVNILGSSTAAVITNIVLGDVDNGYIPVGGDVVGVTNLLNITNILGSSDYMFNVQYQVMMSEIQALTKGGSSMYWQTMNYLGGLDFIMKKEKNFEFNRRMDRLYLEVNWGVDVSVGDVVTAEVYRALNPEEFKEVYDDIWVKRYATALVKRSWGNVLKKYTGMQLPGGLTYNGQVIFDEAVADITKLEEDAINNSAPLNFMVG